MIKATALSAGHEQSAAVWWVLDRLLSIFPTAVPAEAKAVWAETWHVALSELTAEEIRGGASLALGRLWEMPVPAVIVSAAREWREAMRP